MSEHKQAHKLASDSIKAALEETETLKRQLRDLHKRQGVKCQECGQYVPCTTMMIVEGDDLYSHDDPNFMPPPAPDAALYAKDALAIKINEDVNGALGL